MLGLIDRVRSAHFRLVWIVGGTSAERSRVLGECAQKVACPVLNVGRLLSARILDQSAPLRPASAEGEFYELLQGGESDLLFLDRIEILFDAPLMLKAVDLVRNASRRFVIVASWPGAIDSSGMNFGTPDHPSHFRISISEMECPIYTISAS